MIRRLINDDGGFTGLAVAVSAALVLLLVAQATGVQWVHSSGADTQYVADAAALSAGGVVSNWIQIVYLADACVVSMSLVGVLVLLVGTVLACIPATVGVSRSVVDAGRRVLDARDSFVESSLTALDTVQNALPLVVQAQAMAVAREQSHRSDSSIECIAVLFPLASETVSKRSPVIDDQAVVDLSDQAAALTLEANSATTDAESAFIDGWRADCIDDPRSARERASTLASLSGSLNPHYASADGWSFGVALDRARAYYRSRIASESPVTSSLEERVRSKARLEFYRHASDLLAQGYASRSGDLSEGLDLPILPRNTSDMRQTTLYRQAKYPVSVGAGGSTLHVDDACPAIGADSLAGLGSFATVDSGALSRCEACRWSIERIGEAPAASTSIDNGFEFHYRAVALAAARYRESAARANELSEQGRMMVEGGSDRFVEAIARLGSERFEPRPAGHDGVIVIAFDSSARSYSRLGVEVRMGPRFAISGAKSVDEDPEYGQTMMASAFDRLLDRGEGSVSSPVGAILRPAVALWGDALLAYSRGSEALIAAAESLLVAVPGIGGELSGWAGTLIGDVVDAAGFGSASLSIPRPRIVNTGHILATEPSIGAGIAEAKARILTDSSASAGSVGEFERIVEVALAGFQAMLVDRLAEGLRIGEVDLFGVYRIPVDVELPEEVIEALVASIDGITDRARSAFLVSTESPEGGRWE